MKVIETDKVSPSKIKTRTEREWIYNGLDCCVTAEVLEVLLGQLDPCTSKTYEFSKSLQGPVLDMRLRGVLVDQARKGDVIEQYFQALDQLERNLYKIVSEGVGFWGFNWRSNPDLQELFYDRLGIPVIRKQGKPTVNRDALEKLEAYTIAQPVTMHIRALREIKKKIDFLKTGIDPDGRMRTSYNIAGTETGRFASTFSEFGTGTNLQNVEMLLRSVLIADPKMKMGYFDAAQGESRTVGAIEWNLFHDGRYLDACESDDLHTTVAKLCWPELPWTGDSEMDQAIAEEPFYRHYTRRFMCKKIGHGTNYAGQPRTLASQAKVDIGVIKTFQPIYFKAFPAHQLWHEWVRFTLQTMGQLTTLTGRRRFFFGRRDSDDTLREAIAYDPQGSLSDIVNTGMLNLWLHGNCELLLQNHDAVIVQFPEHLEDVIVPKIIEQLRTPIQLKHGRTLTIPFKAHTGWNFSEYDGGINPDGLKEYKPGDKRRRTPQVGLLDRVVRRLHR